MIKALELADTISRIDTLTYYQRYAINLAAEELRRLAAVEAERDALNVENERLTNCLKKANDQAEDFERRWYLADMELDRIRAMEPVAWLCVRTEFGKVVSKCAAMNKQPPPKDPRDSVTPLYALEKP